MEGEVFYTDTFHPGEHDMDIDHGNGEVFYSDAFHSMEHDLDASHEINVGSSMPGGESRKKDVVKKPATRDFTNQKKMTQKIRQLIEDDDLIRVTKLIKKPKPGQLSCGVRRMKHDVGVLARIAPEICKTVIGTTKLKVSEKQKLKELRESKSYIEDELDTPLAPVMLHPAETDLFNFRPPGFDIQTPFGNTQCDIRKSNLYEKAMELNEINTVIRRIDETMLEIHRDQIRSLLDGDQKEPQTFEMPEEETEETCARVRPLLKAIKRPLIHVDLMAKPSTSHLPNDSRVSSMASVHSDVCDGFSLYHDIRPEYFIQEEMARRGYRHCDDHLGRIASMAEGLERNKKAIGDEDDPKSKKKSNRKSDTAEKGDEMIKMVIKRVNPPKGKNANQEATYEISKKEDPAEPKKKYARSKNPGGGKRNSLEGGMPEIPRKKLKLGFNTSSSSRKNGK